MWQILLVLCLATGLTIAGIASAYYLALEEHTREGFDFERLGPLRRVTDDRIYSSTGREIRAHCMRMYVIALSVLLVGWVLGMATA